MRLIIHKYIAKLTHLTEGKILFSKIDAKVGKFIIPV